MSATYKSTYDKHPTIRVSDSSSDCQVGWDAITKCLQARIAPGPFVICVECYPGCFEKDIEDQLARVLKPALFVSAKDCYLPDYKIREICERDLSDDPVFAYMNHFTVADFLDDLKVEESQAKLRSANGLVIVLGTDASLIAEKWD